MATAAAAKKVAAEKVAVATAMEAAHIHQGCDAMLMQQVAELLHGAVAVPYGKNGERLLRHVWQPWTRV